ncbi:MAG: helix-turn-helix transcriptional regulator [Oscillospiraceae bacterium]|nr:helix-turn-helix transcriptional regulator [Oscillospiraceae bacterium]
MASASHIGERLYNIRMKKGETQEKVAESVGISYVSLSRYETGQRMPKMDILARLAAHYGVTVDEIISAEQKKDLTQADEVRNAVLDIMSDLTPSEVQRVADYVAGMKAARKD